jgi:hypothetical protein
MPTLKQGLQQLLVHRLIWANIAKTAILARIMERQIRRKIYEKLFCKLNNKKTEMVVKEAGLREQSIYGAYCF